MNAVGWLVIVLISIFLIYSFYTSIVRARDDALKEIEKQKKKISDLENTIKEKIQIIASYNNIEEKLKRYKEAQESEERTHEFLRAYHSNQDIQEEIENFVEKRTRLGDLIKVLLEHHENATELKKHLDMLWEVWPDYPPDWELRKSAVSKRDGKYCRICGKTEGLDLHHVIPLSEGGLNRIDNLKFLCKQCHAKQHPDNKGLQERADEDSFIKDGYDDRYVVPDDKYSDDSNF